MAPETTSSPSMNGLKGYSDFFASGLRTVGKELTNRRPRQRTRPASYCSTISTTTTATSDSEYSAALIVYPWLPFEHQEPQPRPAVSSKRRPASMLISGTSSPRAQSKEGRARRTFSHLSNRLWDHLSLFPAVPDPPTPTTPTQKSKERKFPSLTEFMRSPSEKPDTQDIWIDKDDSYPSTPVSNILPKHRRMSTFDPFGSLPESKSFFVDFPDTPVSSKATVTTSPAAFIPISLYYSQHSPYPHSAYRPISNWFNIQLARYHCDSLFSQLLCETFTSGTTPDTSPEAVAEQGDYCIPEDEEPVQGHFGEKRDPAACIDWRQFHSDLMEVEV
ncbi:hypothetical protein BKA70DRAFT_1241775 [Coprinopsis sp. MPI-PUGE-AT-0042]|nr:hypothetical protein BKA70DRAFT_1241775 [Coprinopsis sp. MPI-PUGE-AT-0042]